MLKRKLLLADDSITIQKVVNLTFADEGIEVISVGDGDSAMRKFDEFMPDLVMADVNMPGLNGYEVCRIIKQTDETRNIPVILLVGSFEPFDETEAKDAGADDFLTKPFQSIRQLVNKVTDLLNRKEPVSESAPSETQTAPPADSFAETLEFGKPEESSTDFEKHQEISSEFGDAGMDDEMIEASPANEYVSGSELPYHAETAIDYAKTQPLNAEDLKGFDIVSGESNEPETAAAETSEEATQRAEPATFDEEARKLEERPYYEEREMEEEPENVSESEPQIDYYLPTQGEFESRVTDAETLEPEISYSTEQPREADFSEAPAEEAVETVETPPSETEFIEAQEDEGRFEEAVETSEPPQTDTGFIESQEEEERFEETGETVGAPADEDFIETQTTEERFEDFESAPVTERIETEEPQIVEAEVAPVAEAATETTVSAPENIPSLSFDEGDLLELPPLVEETGIRPQAKVQPFVSEPESVAETTAEPEIETAETPTVAEQETAHAFPPELIEAIAQKVAEKISAKTMSDVLPQITELVMKKLAEEKKE